ncbi:MAG: MBL fold metallo-hydrolase [Chthoniobacterales bacterium]
MKIKLLGFGGAFEFSVGNSSFWVEDFHGECLLIDCGYTIFPRLMQLGIDKLPNAILLTHLHADHAGSLTNEIFWLWYHGGKKPVRIYLPAEHFREPLLAFLQVQLITPETYIDLVPLPADGRITPIDTFGEHIPDMPTFGYILRDKQNCAVISGDIANATTIFETLEATGTVPDFVFHELTYDPDMSAHIHYKHLEKWTDRYRIYGYHCDPHAKPADCTIPLAWENPDFHFGDSPS